MKSGVVKKLSVGAVAAVFCGTSALMAMAGGNIMTGEGTVTTETLSEGVTYR